jgi:hypothetical protein
MAAATAGLILVAVTGSGALAIAPALMLTAVGARACLEIGRLPPAGRVHLWRLLQARLHRVVGGLKHAQNPQTGNEAASG